MIADPGRGQLLILTRSVVTPGLHERLLANGRSRNSDRVSATKFLNPLGIDTWLATEHEKDCDQPFGLASLGFAEPGYLGLSEMQTLRLSSRLGIERDLHFEGAFPLSNYAEAGRTVSKHLLLATAASLQGGS